MTGPIYNFSAGPAILPPPVLEKAREELLSLGGRGLSVMEISHRSRDFGAILDAAKTGIRALLDVPENYHVLFLQGGATLQFSMVPMNLLRSGETAEYVITGTWGQKALKAAGQAGSVVYSSEADGFRVLPDRVDLNFSPKSKYIHYTSNETIHGVEFPEDLEVDDIPVVCDASSNILSKPIDVAKYGLIYAGAQKNIGPSGVTLVIIRDDLLTEEADISPMLSYRSYAEHDSMLNTPNTWGIYLISLVTRWLQEQGGVTEIAIRNRAKAKLLYSAIDESGGFYSGHARSNARSLMNVTFRLPSPDLDRQFCEEASARGLIGLAGHRALGGVRASIYNAFPLEGVEALLTFMGDFARERG